MSKPRKGILIILSFFAIYVIWGSTYLMNKIVVTEVAPFLLAAIRFLCAGTLIMIIAKVLKLPIRITKAQFFNCIIAGFLFLFYGNGIFVWALKYVDSGFAALIVATQPLFVIFLMRILQGKKIQPKSLMGVGLGLIGMYLLISQDTLVLTKESTIGIAVIFSCVLGISFASIFVSRANLPSHFFVSTGYQMLTAGTLLLFGSLALGETWTSPLVWSSRAQIAMVLLILFGSIVAFTAFNFLLKEVSTEKVATSAYVNPVIALLLGWYVLDENISTQSLIAAGVLLTGVYFINSKKKIVIFSRFKKNLKQ
ncbi:EamA family transporter [Formosa algae]|uniref:Drug/metabolite transporter (DMT)-like permease n=1 Tax=Formosa algae TaxID=225843 RepID=A0A9X1CCB2_9FLAO|nr:EamA family transporter [Formosa algae]MBP1840932.1 drug/metabolite transporter (DMT)-like permease [Formosa algae]MDQ0336171.1 drug/metabolite transporter (DMT)-like permease [Formosa algae]OEI79948.1 multidrug transporter [Formosa algae]